LEKKNSRKLGTEYEKELKAILKPYFDRFRYQPLACFDYIASLGSYIYLIEAKIVCQNGREITVDRESSWFVRQLARDPRVIPVLIVKVNGNSVVIRGNKVWDFLSRGKSRHTSVSLKGWLDYAIPLEKWLAKLRGIRKKLEARRK